MGKSQKSDADKKKKKKPETVTQERIEKQFNIHGAGGKDQDDLKRKREEFAV